MCIKRIRRHYILVNFKQPLELQMQIYFLCCKKSLVQPILEYAAPVWSPYLVKDIPPLESEKRVENGHKPT